MHKMILIITLKRKIVITALPLFGMAKKRLCGLFSLRFLCFSILYCFEKSTFVIVHSCPVCSSQEKLKSLLTGMAKSLLSRLDTV